MRCKYCSGLVEWQGALFNPTHSLCVRCGAVNSQVDDVIDHFEYLGEEITEEQAQEKMEKVILIYTNA